MTGKRFRAAALAPLFAAAVAQATPDADGCMLSIGWTNYEPHAFTGSGGQPIGADVDVFEAALAEIGCAADWRPAPWARLLHEIEIGAVDAAPYAIRLAEREAFAAFSLPYMCETTRIWAVATRPLPAEIRSLSDLRDTTLSIGVIRNAVYSSEYSRLLNDPTMVARFYSVTDGEKQIELLNAGRVDGVIARDMFMRYRMGRADAKSGFVPADVDLASDSVSHFMFSKAATRPGLVQRFDRALTTIVADGRYDAIVSAYNGDPERLRPRYAQDDPCAQPG